MSGMQAESRLADQYVLVRRLASGGMGEVWLARDVVLGREVAVKVIAVGSDGDPQAVERFRREATMAAALEHPNIVTIFDEWDPRWLDFHRDGTARRSHAGPIRR